MGSSLRRSHRAWLLKVLGVLATCFVAGLVTAGVVSGTDAIASLTTEPSSVSKPYLVQFAAGTSAETREQVLDAAGAEEVSAVEPLRIHGVLLPSGDALAAALAALESSPAVTTVEENREREVDAAPSDPGYGAQWSLPKIGWDEAFGTVAPGDTARVAILDTGVDGSHPDLDGNLVPGTSILDGSDGLTDPNGHGTAMAGIVAAETDNGDGIAGVGYAGVDVMPVTVLAADGTGQDGDIIDGVVFAAQHDADVILMAFSNPGYSELLQEAINYAWAQGAVLVAATGNDGSSTPTFPAGDRGVIGVSNTDQDDALNASSNSGQAVFLGAPGTDIVTTNAGGGTTSITGTSASAAHVAGAAALIKAASGASNGVVVSRLARHAEPVGTRDETGNGRLNLDRALADSSSDPIQPAGAAPVGGGGPIVGPYVAAAPDAEIDVAPTHVAATGTHVFTALVRNTQSGNGNTARCVRVALPASVTVVSATFTVGNPGNGAGQSGTWNLTQTGSTVEIRTTADGSGSTTTGLIGSSNRDWARFEITANATSAGTGTWTSSLSTSRTQANCSDVTQQLAVSVAQATTRVYTADFRDALGNVLPAPTGVGSAEQTYRVRFTRTAGSDDLSYGTLALPTCFTGILVTGITDSGPPTGWVGNRTDNVIRLTTGGNKLAANGQWVQVQFNATPDCAQGALVFRTASWKGTAPSTSGGDIFRHSAQPPVAVDDTYTTSEDTDLLLDAGAAGLGVSPVDNDTDANGDTRTVTAVSNPSGGSVNLASETITFAPTANLCGVGAGGFDYTVSDGNGGTDIGRVTVNITCVNDPPAIAFTSGSLTANEGDTKTYAFGITDPDSTSFTFDVGYPQCGVGGTVDGTPTLDASSGSFDCSFEDGPASPTLASRIRDATHASNVITRAVTVANVPPTVTLTGPDAADEGDTKAYTYTVTDPGTDPNPLVTESCGAHGTRTDTATPDHFTCTFADGPNDTTVQVSANDGDLANHTGTDTIEVTVSNLPPVVELSGDATADEGDTNVYTYTVTDPGTDPNPLVTESCGAHGTRTDTATPDHFTCTFADGPNDTTVQVSANDGDLANHTGTDTIEVTVSNLPPVVELSGDATADEGDTNVYTYTVTDPGTDPNPLVTESCGAHGTRTDTATPDHFTCTFADGPNDTTVQVSANDGDLANHTGTDTIEVTVSNLPPVVELSGDATADEGDTNVYTYTVTDPGTDPNPLVTESCGAHGTRTDTATPDHFTCTFADGPNDTTVQVSANDGDLANHTGTDTIEVTVSNLPPVVELSGDATADEGDTNVYTYTVTDPGTDPNPLVTESCGAHGTRTDTATPDHFTCTFADGPNDTTVQVSANDGDLANHTGTDTIEVTVSNLPPVVELSGDATADEGDTNVYTYTVTDPGTDPNPLVTESCGAHGTRTDTATPDHFTCTFADGPNDTTVQVSANDGDLANHTGTDTIEVTVTNVAPSIVISGDVSVAEGASYELTLGAVTDPGSDTVTAYVVHWGDGDNDEYTSAGATTHTYADGLDTHAITIDLEDDDGTHLDRANAHSVEVTNVDPTVTVSGDASIPEGQQRSYQISTSDPGAETFTLDAHSCGAAGTLVAGSLTFTPATGAGSFTCDFADGDASGDVTATVSDGDGGSDSDSKPVTITNVAPSIVISGDVSVAEGASYELTLGAVTDPGSDTVTAYVVHWGDGDNDEYTSAGATTHTYADGLDTHAITIDLEDDDGTHLDRANAHSVEVTNVDPTVTVSGDASIPEGQQRSYQISTSDPGAETFTLDAHSCGAAGTLVAGSLTFTPATGAGSFTCDFADGDASGDVTATVSDGDGGSDSDSKPVTVTNVAPSIVISGDVSVAEGASYELTLGAVTDPGSDTVTAYVVHWGDGDNDEYTSAGATTHTYADGLDTHAITIDLEDDDGTHLDRANAHSVEVTNVDPTVTVSGDASIPEGQQRSYQISTSDPGAETFTLDAHSCGAAGTLVAGSLTFTPATGAGSFTCDFADGDASGDVTATVSDGDGGSDSDSKPVTITNVAPSIVISGDVSVAEGASYELTLGAVTDPGSDTVTAYVVHWGDGDNDEYTSAGATTHTYADGLDTHAITIDLEDDDGTHLDRANAHSVEVTNVDPTVTVSGDASIPEGQQRSYQISTSDPGAETFTLDAHSCGAAGTLVAGSLTFTPATGAGSFTCDFADGDASGDVTATVSDGDGGSDSDSKPVTITNVAPMVTLSGPTLANEGQTKTYAFDTSDPGVLDTFTLDTSACGDSGGVVGTVVFDDATGDGSFDCLFDDDDPSATLFDTSTVEVEVSDDQESGSDTHAVTVSNLDPTVAIASPLPGMFPVGGTITVAATFSDAGLSDDHTCTINGVAGDVDYSEPGEDTCTGDVIPPAGGAFTITVVVTDDDLGSDSAVVVLNALHAIYAHEKCTGGSGKGLLVNGTGMDLDGTIHSNGNFKINGSNFASGTASLYRPQSGCSTVYQPSKVNFGPPSPTAPVNVPLQNWPWNPSKSEFPCTHPVKDDWVFNGSNMTIPEGVYCAKKSFKINGSNITGEITVLAPEIVVNGKNINLSWHTGGMLLFAINPQTGALSSKEIVMNGELVATGLTLTGVIHNPGGGVKVNGTAKLHRGFIQGRWVELNGSGFRMTY